MILQEIGNDYFTGLKNIFHIDNYNQYRFYPSQFKNGWVEYGLKKLNNKNNNKECYFYYKSLYSSPILISIRISKWDEDQFNVKIAILEFSFFNDDVSIEELNNSFREIFHFLYKKNIAFVSIRVNGDNLKVIHFLESNGFKYIEDVIWPVLDCRKVISKDIEGVRIAVADDLEKLKYIASNFQYQRGHFHCDEKFDKMLVNNLYAKWVESAFERGDPILVLEDENILRGYFVMMFDENLSSLLGYKYGRMRSLALDSEVRGKGLGKKLFTAAINWMKANGADFIDSGYSTKNHVSAKLHTLNNFYSVYEEITLHKWL